MEDEFTADSIQQSKNYCRLVKVYGEPQTNHCRKLAASLPIWMTIHPSGYHQICSYSHATECVGHWTQFGWSSCCSVCLWLPHKSLPVTIRYRAVLIDLSILPSDKRRKISGVYTFGCPRVGDRDFAERYNTMLVKRTFRFINRTDPVTRVPRWGYKHVGKKIHLLGQRAKSLLPSVNDHFIKEYVKQIIRHLSGKEDGE